MSRLQIDQLKFDNRFSSLGSDFFSRVPPTPFEDWQLIHFNPDAGRLLDLAENAPEHDRFTAYLTGMQPWPGSAPLSMLYAGHQFGMWVPQLGDGRAILMGQTKNRRDEYWDIQIKGGGPTPYSRFADGRAVLRSTIREYLCSEAMHGLSIPTTRALAMFRSESTVMRELPEPAALLVRLANSHIRFGSFEVFASRGQSEQIKILADHVIELFFAELSAMENPYAGLYQFVADSTANLIAGWQAVGFAHGVMNTDNMSILGQTIDYGPFGFMEAYDPDFVCNHSDHHGRYAFNRQPDIAMWNLACLGNTLLNLIPQSQAQSILDSFNQAYETAWREKMQQKLGLQEADKEFPGLLNELLKLLAADRVDYSIFFRKLSWVTRDNPESTDPVRDLFVNRPKFERWWKKYCYRIDRQSTTDNERGKTMRAVNPKYVLRNYLAQQAIEQAHRRDYTMIDDLLRVLKNPFDEHPEYESFADHPPDWASGISVSCSS